VAEATRSLSIGSCWIFLLAEGETAEEENASPGIGDPEKPLEKRRFQIALWLQNGTREIDKEGRRGLIGGFLKEILSERAAGRHFFGRVLHVRSSIQGFILFDLGEIDCRVFESLGLLTSSALRSAAILERLVRTQDELRDLAENDSLTGLGNRFSFYKRFRGLVEKPEAGDGRQMALMLLDVDGFKPVNDSFGHDAGDMLLIQIARRLARVLGSASLGVFRLGGDEFTAIFMSSGPDDTDSIARRVLDAIKEPFEHQGRIMRVTGSLGIAHFPRDGKDPAELMKFVDLALYRAKETKGSVVVFDRLKDAYLLRRAGLTRDIQSVVDKGEIEVYYQGIFEGDGTVVGIEALVRWHHPLLGMLMPREFLDIAVASNMIIPIETYVLSQACRHARELAADHGKEFFVLVNSTNTFFYSQDFIDIVRRTIERSGIDPGRLKLGLEERFSYGDPDRALAIIGELRKHRIEFAVDGLGGESSWLHFLKELPENTIVKIDRGFVRHIETSASDRTFLYRILSLLESRGFKVAVSGIENEEQQNMLKRRNCLFQGFALAEPITFEKLKPKLKSRSRRPAKGS
jgi:diguanylate cyclase (GGDEF)-like protein